MWGTNWETSIQATLVRVLRRKVRTTAVAAAHRLEYAFKTKPETKMVAGGIIIRGAA